MKDEKRGIIISLIIWVLLMFMTLTRWMGDGILKEIGDYIAITFGVIITLLVGTGTWSMRSFIKQYGGTEDEITYVSRNCLLYTSDAADD